MPSYLITGASRGLGLGYASELIRNPDNIVIATARNTAGSTGLQELKAKNDQLILIDLEVSKPESIKSAAKKAEELLPDGALDNLISNAGVSYNQNTTDIQKYTNEVAFAVSTPLMVLREFLPLIRKGQVKKAMFITSILGSVQYCVNLQDLMNAYSVARAGMNMMVRKWSPLLKAEGITVALVHPGWIGETDIGGEIEDWVMENNPTLQNLTVEQSCANCLKVLDGLTLEDAGAYFNHEGSNLPF